MANTITIGSGLPVKKTTGTPTSNSSYIPSGLNPAYLTGEEPPVTDWPGSILGVSPAKVFGVGVGSISSINGAS